jgi:NAD(P)-dependent dehydrogenase (short-subunit alcohol dehydrogenase family)
MNNTNNKLILLTGGNRGVGAAIAEVMQDQGQLITVARTGNVTEHGDLTDSEFRTYLADKYSPDVFINCAALTENNSIDDILKFTGNSVIDLLFKFYAKARSGCDIVNISSWRGWYPGAPGMSDEFVAYSSSKHFLSSASQMLALQKKPNVRVMCLETGGIATANYPKMHLVTDKSYSEFDGSQTAPIPPSHVAETVKWMLNQPRWINPGVIRLLNNF